MQILRTIRRENLKVRAQITKLQKQLKALEAAAAAFGSIAVKGFSKKPRKNRRISTKGRLAISRATKARWAKFRASKKPAKKADKKAA
jgi:hypothetical protein